jgi:hypothetical protein
MVTTIFIAPGGLLIANWNTCVARDSGKWRENTGETGRYRTLMRRFPWLVPPDNDAAPKNAWPIPEPGHKPGGGVHPRFGVLAGPGTHRTFGKNDFDF